VGNLTQFNRRVLNHRKRYTLSDANNLETHAAGPRGMWIALNFRCSRYRTLTKHDILQGRLMPTSTLSPYNWRARSAIGVIAATALLICARQGDAQVFPSDPNVSSQPVKSKEPAAPQKKIAKGVDQQRDREAAQPGERIENEEDESMVLKRLEYLRERHRLSAEEEKVGRSQLKLRGLDEVKKSKPVPAVLPQLRPRSLKVSAQPVAGPPADAEALAIAPAGQVFGSKWVELGPNVVYNGQPTGGARCKVGGRVTCAAFDPSDATYQSLYLGTADGGVWKTTNHGGTWTPLSDFQPSLSIGSITVNPAAANEVYVGTGENVLSGDAISGVGVLVSTDGGATWVNRQSSTMGGTAIGRIALDSATTTGATRHLVAATMKGLFATNDSFQNVTLVSSGSYTDVLQDLSNPQVWWATRNSSGAASLYKSTNNGVTWTQQNTGIPTNLPYGLAAIAQAPSNPSIMYAVFNANTGYTQQNIYKSINGGASWSQIDTGHLTSVNSGQFFYNVYVAINPTNANDVYVGGSVPIYRSTNGGTSFTDVASNRSVHADHHFGLFRPNGTRFYDGNDGGLFYTDNPGVSDWVSMNTGLGILQVNEYALALHPTRFEILAGTQDNGTPRYLGSGIWSLVNFGDGGFTFWDPTDSRYVYNGYIYSNIYRSTMSGYDWDDITPSTTSFPSNNYSFPFYPKAALNPTNTNMVVLAGDSLLRNSVARTANVWTDVTGKLNGTRTISAVAFAPSDGEVCYIGYTDGKVYRTGNMSALNPTWNLVMSHPSSTYCTDLAVYPADPNHFVGVFYTYTGNKVYEVTNAAGGATLTSRNSGFPAIAPNCISVDASNTNVWYVGTDAGVYRTVDGGASWQNFSTGLPNAAVYDLTLDNSRSILLAGTHGRGVWMVARPELKLSAVSFDDNGNNGNGNGSVDQNETLRLTISLANAGSENASGVTAMLSPISPDVNVLQASSTYNDIAAGGGTQANTAPFVIRTVNPLAPGKKLTLVLTVSSNDGNFAVTIPVELRSGVATTLLDVNEGFESGFGGFTQSNQNGASWSWQADTSKPGSGTRCAHFEEPYPYEYQLDFLKSPVSSIPANANRVTVSFDQTNASTLYGYAGGKVFLVKDGGASIDMAAPLAGVVSIQNGYTGQFAVNATLLYSGQDGYVNGGPGLPYSTTVLDLDPAQWAGHSIQVIFAYNYWGFNEKLNGPTGWFIDNYRVKAENYSIQYVNAAEGWELLR
jgi:photosystem II stability/assembly factor-like uncharacterized protein